MNLNEKAINDYYVNYIKENFSLCKNKAMDMAEYLEHSQLYYNGKMSSYTLMIPKVYTKETYINLCDIQNKISNIANTVTKRYISDPSFRDLFKFDKRLENLILLEQTYDSLVPMARYDIFYNEETGDFKFCEFNTDGTSGMNRNRIIDEAYFDNPAHQNFIYNHNAKPFELIDSWVDTFLELYNTYKNKSKSISIAIVDFLDKGNVNEFKEFSRRFQNKGVFCTICDIRDLEYKNNALYTKDGYKIDAVYRRAVTSDILNHFDEVLPFVNCVKDGNVMLCGSFATQVIHNKMIFPVLHSDYAASFLSKSECDFIKKHIPETYIFNTLELKEKALKNKDKYIIKPLDSYDGKGVLAGVSASQSEWEKAVSESFSDDYILQEYCPQYNSVNIDLVHGDGSFSEYINMTGIYSYNGKLAGFYNRQSKYDVITTAVEEMTVPTYLLS